MIWSDLPWEHGEVERPRFHRNTSDGAGAKRVALLANRGKKEFLPDGTRNPNWMTDEKAQELIDKWFSKAQGLRKWLDLQKAYAQNPKVGYTTTERGRKRFYRPMDPDDPDAKEKEAKKGRQAGNQPIQSECVDMLKQAMVLISLALHGGKLTNPRIYDAHFLSCVHDEILMTAREEHAEPVAKIMKKCMEKVYNATIHDIPGKVDVTIADYWKK